MQDILKKLHLLHVSFLIILLFSGLLADCLFPSDSSALINIKVGDSPKEIVLNDLQGETVNVSDYFGQKPVILLFWKLTTNEAFLNYSIDELRFLNDYYKEYHDKSGLEIFAIYTPLDFKNVPETEISSVRSLIETNGIKIPVLIDRGFKFFRDYGVIALPSTIMVGKSGVIEFIYSSFPMAAHVIIADKIEELLGNVETTQKRAIVKKKKAETQAKKFYNYALHMSKRGLLEQALSAMKKSLDLDPEDSLSHNLMGIIFWKKGIYDKSMEEFRNAIALDKSNIAAHINYTVLLIKRHRYEEAEKILISLPSAEFKYKVRAHHLLGIVYKETKKIDRAIEELEKARGLFKKEIGHVHKSTPSYYSVEVSVSHGLSVLYGKKGDNKKALEMLHEAFHSALGLDSTSSVEHLGERTDLMIYE